MNLQGQRSNISTTMKEYTIQQQQQIMVVMMMMMKVSPEVLALLGDSGFYADLCRCCPLLGSFTHGTIHAAVVLVSS